jgi:Zn-dependent protease with chaperone function
MPSLVARLLVISVLPLAAASAPPAETAVTARGWRVSCKSHPVLDSDGHLTACVLAGNTAFANSYGDTTQPAPPGGGIPCKGGALATFNQDGNLESCTLSSDGPVTVSRSSPGEDAVSRTFACKAGTVMGIAPNGFLTRCQLASALVLFDGSSCKAGNIVAITESLALSCNTTEGKAAAKPAQKFKNYLDDVNKGINFFSESDEYELGRRYADQMNQLVSLVGDEEAQSYIESLGNRLVAASRKPDLNCQYFLVNTSEVNAFAVPGCFVYVNRGLIELAQSEGQLAGVLGHEIGHVIAHHGVKLMSHDMILEAIVAGAAAVAGEKSETLESLIELGGGMAYLFSALKYSRDDEHQADALGAETMAAAGYDPDDLVNFFHAMDPSRNPDAAAHVLGILSTHPLIPDREAALLQQIAGMSYSGEREAAAVQPFLNCKTELSARAYPPPDQEVTLSAALASLQQ